MFCEGSVIRLCVPAYRKLQVSSCRGQLKGMRRPGHDEFLFTAGDNLLYHA